MGNFHFNNRSHEISFSSVYCSPACWLCWTFLMLFFYFYLFSFHFLLPFSVYLCHLDILTFPLFISDSRLLPSLLLFLLGSNVIKRSTISHTPHDVVILVHVRLCCCFHRSRSRHAEPEKPKKKKTTATSGFVSIPNTIKLSMLNSGLLSYDKVRLSVKGKQTHIIIIAHVSGDSLRSIKKFNRSFYRFYFMQMRIIRFRKLFPISQSSWNRLWNFVNNVENFQFYIKLNFQRR